MRSWDTYVKGKGNLKSGSRSLNIWSTEMIFISKMIKI